VCLQSMPLRYDLWHFKKPLGRGVAQDTLCFKPDPLGNMANQTITTGTPASPINYDDASISGLLNGEDISINGGALKIDSDVRLNQQAAVFGNITLSSTLGGSFVIDGSQVWEIPFSASSGNVPTQGALGTNNVTGGTSGATGELTRIWATGSLTPVAAGGAMPATGFIKLRIKTGTFQSGETITLPGGATITASSGGNRSWIHVVGRTSTRVIIPRLGNFSSSGDWYELGTTNGTDNQTFQFPVTDVCPVIWIETSSGSGVYEKWLNASTRWLDGAVATDKRGMCFYSDAATGALTIAARGANNAGFKPPTGCKVRIPNIIMSNADSTAYNVNVIPAAATSRYAFNTSAGALVLDKVTCNWHVSVSNAYLIDIQNSSIGGQSTFSTTIGTTTVRNVGFGIVDALLNSPINISTNYVGGTIEDVSGVLNNTQNSIFRLINCANFTLNQCRGLYFGAPVTNAPNSGSRSIELNSVSDIVINNFVSIGAPSAVAFFTASKITVNNTKYASRSIGTTQTDGLYALAITQSASNVVVDGFSNYENLTNVHPYLSVAALGSGAINCEIRNIGTAANPYDGGSINSCGYIATLSVSNNIKMRRCYAINMRVGAVQTASSVNGFNAYNLWGDTADIQIINNLNSTIQGGRFSAPTSGQANVFGTHWMDAWTSTTAGFILIACNEPTSSSLSQCSASLGLGSGFTAIGSVAMKLVTDSVIWEMPYFALGVTGFANVAPTVTGTNTANHTLAFQYDIGSGYNGTWLALTGTNLSSVTVTPAIGVKLKVRATINTANVNNLLTYIRIDTITNATDQTIEYPFPGSIVNVNNLVANSRVKITRIDTGAVLQQLSSGAGTSVQFDVNYTGSVAIEARNASGSPAYKPWFTQVSISPTATANVVALQESDQ
jgi:hypothetical protein